MPGPLGGVKNSVANFLVEADIELRALEPRDAVALESLRHGYTAHQNEWLYHGTAGDFIQSLHSEYQRSGSLGLGIFERGSLAGILICKVDTESRSLSLDYGLGNRFRGRGLVTRGIARVLDHFFEDRHFLEAYVSIDPENLKSIAVAQRLGFRPNETIRGAAAYGSGRGDIRRFRLTSTEWHAA
jgi:ribosomal-protein-serine acetyltransferase